MKRIQSFDMLRNYSARTMILKRFTANGLPLCNDTIRIGEDCSSNWTTVLCCTTVHGTAVFLKGTPIFGCFTRTNGWLDVPQKCAKRPLRISKVKYTCPD